MNMHPAPGHLPSERIDPRGRDVLLWLTGAVLILALLIGGASRENLLQVSLIELASLPLLGLAIWRLSTAGGWAAVRVPALIIAMAVAVPLLQLIPLPFETWASLPGRALAADALKMAGLDHGWRPISLVPLESWRHALALLPPAAVFLAAACLKDGERRWITLIIPAVAALSLMVGIAQLAGGNDSTFYIYDTTNYGAAVGLFANRNHQAALLVASLPFAVLYLDFRTRDPRRLLLAFAAAGALVLVEIVALVVVQSRAGVLLLVPALVGGLLLIWRAGERRMAIRAAGVLGLVTVAALGAAFLFGGAPLMERFSQVGDGRLHTAPVTAQAAMAHMPLGAGLGSFPQVYAGLEPIETMGTTYWNHAHNDYLEIALDAGIPGLLVLGAFLIWWLGRVWAAWRGETLAAHLARIAGVATALLLIHSIVDYPLRTLALACVFAFACGLMTPVPPSRQRPSGAR